MSNIQHSSESVEHFTPIEVVDAARELMGGIDLDPASNKLANSYIRARRIFTEKDNGLKQRWSGHARVFLNPPGGLVDYEGRRVIRAKKGVPGCTETGECGLAVPHVHEGVTSSAKVWWQRLSQAWGMGHIKTALFVGFTLEILQSTQVNSLGYYIPLQFPCCYPSTRLRFLSMKNGRFSVGDQPTHANVLVYLPRNWDAQEKKRFNELFSDFGHCVWPAAKVGR